MRRWVIIIVAGVAALAVVGAGAPPVVREVGRHFNGPGRPIVHAAGRHFDGPTQPIVHNAHVDQTEAAIRARYGEPGKDRSGYYALGFTPAELPAGTIRTLVFHLSGATLWVWLEQQ